MKSGVWSSGSVAQRLSGLLFIVVLGVLLWQAWHPWWRPHLQQDFALFHSRGLHFVETGSWLNLGFNEYQPAALWFFVLLAWLVSKISSLDASVLVLIALNIILLTGHYFFYRRAGPAWSRLVFVSLLVAMGPLLLYRFELLASLPLLLAWYFFTRQRPRLSAAWLGLAAALKLYPIILLPLWWAEMIRRRRWVELLWISIIFSFVFALPVDLYLRLGGDINSFINSVTAHQLKPLAWEGLWGSGVLLVQLVTDVPVQIMNDYGINGFKPGLLPLDFFNSVWLVPVGTAFLMVLWLFRSRGYTDPLIPLLLLTVFVLFTKVMNPQYLWWFLSFLPLVPIALYGGKWQRWLLLLAVWGSLFITQLIYPIRYTKFLHGVVNMTTSTFEFDLVIIRNVLLILFLGLLCAALWRRSVSSTQSGPH